MMARQPCRKGSLCLSFFLSMPTRVRVKINPREKDETRQRERTNFLSPRRVSPFSCGVIFTRAHVSLALLSLRKNGEYSTRSLELP